MKAIALSLLVCVAAVGAANAQRVSTAGLFCAQAQDLVASRGAVVMNTGRYTYERFVSHPGYCDPHQTVTTGWAPTRNSAECPVAYRCILRDPDDDPFRRLFRD